MLKMNNKGFTLVELLATIALLAIISTVTVVSVVKYYESSENKAEEAFIKQLEGYVDDYISLYGSKLNFGDEVTYEKCYLDDSDCKDIELKKANNNKDIKFITDYFANQDVFNPKTNVRCDGDNTELVIYRDEDYVYCFTIKHDNVDALGNEIESCISETISTCENMYKDSSGNYVSFK